MFQVRLPLLASLATKASLVPPAKARYRRAPGRTAVATHVDVSAPVHGETIAEIGTAAPHERVPDEIAVAVQLGHKPVVRAPAVGLHGRAPGGAAVAGHVDVPAAIDRNVVARVADQVVPTTAHEGHPSERRVDHELLAVVVVAQSEPDFIVAQQHVRDLDEPPLAVDVLPGDRGRVGHRAAVVGDDQVALLIQAHVAVVVQADLFGGVCRRHTHRRSTCS